MRQGGGVIKGKQGQVPSYNKSSRAETNFAKLMSSKEQETTNTWWSRYIDLNIEKHRKHVKTFKKYRLYVEME
jgi:hypothetical protein